jgi:NADPH-dependent 2,4-dienoyl-CoA reductase/sulfur reductase-like enzyme
MLPYAARIREEVSVPVIAVGRLDDPDVAERAVADGSTDIVLLGRGLLADPDWPRKLEQGRRDEIRPCIACNACVDRVALGLDIRCAVNAELGRESTWHIEPAPAPRRVMVVGSGPGGMEAAVVSRARGHDVSIWERDEVLGGKLDVASRAPSKAEVLRFREYQVRALERLGVEIHAGIEVTPELVEREHPDVVVVATGADPLFPPIAGIDGPGVVDAQELLYRRIEIAPSARVVIVGGSATGCETAELLAEEGFAVAIVEMLPSVGKGIEAITRRHLVRKLKKEGVEILTGRKVTTIAPGVVLYEAEDGSRQEIAADVVALAVGWRPRGDDLALPLAGREVIVLGDASRPADFVAAVGAGADAGAGV